MARWRKRPRKKEGRCPFCGSREVIPIVYGYPASTLLEKAQRGEVKLGGCLISPHNPDWSCKSCGCAWK